MEKRPQISRTINRIRRRFRTWMRHMFDPKHSTKISKEERYFMIIVTHLLKSKNSELLMVPDMNKFYIKSDDGTLFIIIDLLMNEGIAINHVFGYNIKLSPRVSLYVYDKFIHEVEIRRNNMENEYRNNIQNSLHAVVNHYLKDIANESVQS